MPLKIFLDESGDHTLEVVNIQFPIFALSMFICDEGVLNNQIAPAIRQLKINHCGHENVILHSRDIRRAQKDFLFLRDPIKKEAFYNDLNKIMSESNYRLITSVIRKQAHMDRYGIFAQSPYDLSLKFSMERLVPFLEGAKHQEVDIIAESRGKNEDANLETSFQYIANYGTEYLAAARFKRIKFNLSFEKKAPQNVGTQMADLAAYPIARYYLDTTKPSPAYLIIIKKCYRIKIFP